MQYLFPTWFLMLNSFHKLLVAFKISVKNKSKMAAI